MWTTGGLADSAQMPVGAVGLVGNGICVAGHLGSRTRKCKKSSCISGTDKFEGSKRENTSYEGALVFKFGQVELSFLPEEQLRASQQSLSTEL